MPNTPTPRAYRKPVNLTLSEQSRAALAARPGDASRWVDALIRAELAREVRRAARTKPVAA